ncbi:MAG: thrombospondin type 3 repeat-containing protein [Bacteroidia bacterium]
MKRFLTVLFFLTVSLAFAQQASQAEETVDKHKPSVMVGVSALKFMGYVGSNSDLNPLLDTRLGYFLCVEQRFGKVLGVELGGLYGKLAGTDNSTVSHLNFQSQIMQGHLSLTANFDRLFKEDPAVSPFINVGIGYLMFTSYGDNKAANGKDYNYWKDGSIRDQPDSAQYQTTAQVLKRDYNYETQLKTNNVTGCLVVPVGGGLNFHFGRRWTASIGVNYTMCMTQWIDNTGLKSNAYVSGNVGLQYEFKKKGSSKTEARYQNVDFASVDHLDADKDGVPDDQDDCHGTPQGAKVDKKGCPIDSDGDGVPDYMDKEATTAKGAKVDGFGVTINEEEIAKHQKEWESEAPERSKEFNVAPSKAYLEKIEAEAKKVRSTSGNSNSKIPAELRGADANNDGYISADEITKTIDAFFDGSSDFTVEKINRLIDYFFEQ